METKKTTVWVILAILLAVLIVGVIVIKSKSRQEVVNTNQEEQEMFEKTIDLKHQYKDGKHIFAGKLEVPTPCHQVNLSVTPGEVAELNFDVKDSGEKCEQKVVDANFFVEFPGEANQLFVGKLNGEPVNLNQFEVDADIDINSVDIFMKG